MVRFIEILFSLMFALSLAARSPFSVQTDSLIRGGIDQTMRTEFDSALTTFQKLEILHPNHMVGLFYQTATLQSMMMDYETSRWEVLFYHTVDSAIARGLRQLELNDNDPWTYFYLGSSYSYKGLYQAKAGSLVPGIISAKKGIGFLEKAIELDSTLYDAYLGIGSYKYWSGRFYKYLRWLPFIRDERDKGIFMIQQSLEKGTFSYWVGINSLGWIHYDRKQYAASLELFQEGLTAYPGSRFFLWGAADCYFKMELWKEAVQSYDMLLRSIVSSPGNNGYNEAECRLKLMRSYEQLKDYSSVILHSDAILKLDFSEDVARRIEPHQQEAGRFQKRAKKALNR